MEWTEINFFAIATAVLLLFNICEGYKKGMVRKLISFISLIFLCLIVALAGNAIASYSNGKTLNVLLMIFLLAVLGIVQHFIKVAVFPAKVISKLPIIHSVDKLCGIVIGILETVISLWILYVFVALLDLGIVGEYIAKGTRDVFILEWIYEHNYLISWLHILGATITEQLHIV